MRSTSKSDAGPRSASSQIARTKNEVGPNGPRGDFRSQQTIGTKNDGRRLSVENGRRHRALCDRGRKLAEKRRSEGEGRSRGLPADRKQEPRSDTSSEKRREARSRKLRKKDGAKAGAEVEDLGQRVGANAEVGDFEKKSVQRPEPRSRTSGKETAGPEVEELGQKVGANAEVGNFEKKSVQRPEPRSRTSGKDTAGPGVGDLGRKVGANVEVEHFEKETMQRPEPRSETQGRNSAGPGVQNLGQRVDANAEV